MWGSVLRINDLGRLPGRTLILWLDHPTSVTGHTYLSFGRLAFLSPINSTHLSPSHPSTFPLHIRVHVPPRGCDRRRRHEGEERVSIDLVDERANAEMPLERRDVAFVGTNRVRRQVLGDEKPAEVLLARVTDLHTSPHSSCGLAPVRPFGH
jgi:hypothetical protein